MEPSGPGGHAGTSRLGSAGRRSQRKGRGLAQAEPSRRARPSATAPGHSPVSARLADTKPALRHVALLIETSGSYGRGLLRGVAKYNREHGGWSTHFQPRGLGQPPPQWLKDWKGDGILARIDTPEMTQILQHLGIPVINLRGMVPEPPFPYVKGDHARVSNLAAEHLLERGLKNFAFVGRPAGVHSGLDERREAFCRAIAAANYACDIYPAAALDSWEQEQDKLTAWLKALPKPTGIMACNDERGLLVLDACRRAGVAVPDEVAVIGVDNDDYLCELSIPQLTSVDVNAEQIGYQAAQLLDQLMAGRKANERQVVPPRGVVTRLSTDVVASDDDEVNRAIRFIRERGCRGLRVKDVLAHLGISRASLQQRMKRVIGHTIHEEIERLRLSRVKELLLRPDMTIKQVAREAGFSSVQYMTRVFRVAMGETPARYRDHRDKGRGR